MHATAAPSLTLGDIETLAKNFEAEAAELEECIHDLEADLEAVKAKHLRNIKKRAGIVANAEAALRQAIEIAPHLFEKPRTLTIHGVKVGYTTSNGRVEWDDDEMVLKLIRKYHKDDTDTLIRSKEEPNKDALRSLTATELAKLGCTIEGAGDVVIVKRVAGEVETLITRLQKKLVEKMIETEG